MFRDGVGSDYFWNESGCSTINFENGSVMCSCNQLTHFGILLSPEQPDNVHKLIQKCIKLFLYYNMLLQNIPPLLILIWQVYSSISLVFLLATILTFLLQKSAKVYSIDYFCCIFFTYRSLWNMRNYIHCMLCGSMFTAQLLYTFGINKTENEVL